jgi:hypothetical protein
MKYQPGGRRAAAAKRCNYPAKEDNLSLGAAVIIDGTL